MDKDTMVAVTPSEVMDEAEGAAQWLEQMADRFEAEWPNTAKHCRFHVNSLRAAIAQSAEREQLMAPYIRHLAVCELDMRMGKPCSCGLAALARHRIQSEGRTEEREGVENVGCNYCGAQVALMGADYLEQLADALDKVGAPRKSPDGNEHYGLEKRIAALGEGRPGEGEALRAIREIEPEELWGIPDRCTGDRPSFQTLDANEVFAIIDAALSQRTAGEDGA